jgi:hypothetical protein
MSARQTYSIDEIKDMLHARIDQVVDHYAPRASGSYIDKGLYFTLNPGRADRSVGSFCVHLSGPKIGRWNDYATGDRGDVIDLIRMSLGLSDNTAAFREARAFLGLETETPEIRIARAKAIERAKVQRKAAEEAAAAEAIKRQKHAEALYLSGREDLFGTPVQYYLAGRGIDLSDLPHPPGALRYHAALGYYREDTDPETGEVTTTRSKLPGMVAAMVNGRGQIVACHRTYLHLGDRGWTKANLPDDKKVLGSIQGASIRLSSGIGPKGGKGVPLAQCAPGTRVIIGEGIETCLSAMLLWPSERVLAAYSLTNMGRVELPRNVSEVVLLCDNDEHQQAKDAFEAAVQAHAKAGRLVRVWRSEIPGEDLNDALKRAINEQGAA